MRKYIRDGFYKEMQKKRKTFGLTLFLRWNKKKVEENEYLFDDQKKSS
jgi:hypothetical protein